mmetsp:Transcript_6225/g.13610  ORF Transcript_6225/g.13610 Transcript_6225/m.13610 type:complete len:346 (+) Transcript_6225:473-1510(+)
MYPFLHLAAVHLPLHTTVMSAPHVETCTQPTCAALNSLQATAPAFVTRLLARLHQPPQLHAQLLAQLVLSYSQLHAQVVLSYSRTASAQLLAQLHQLPQDVGARHDANRHLRLVHHVDAVDAVPHQLTQHLCQGVLWPAQHQLLPHLLTRHVRLATRHAVHHKPVTHSPHDALIMDPVVAHVLHLVLQSQELAHRQGQRPKVLRHDGPQLRHAEVAEDLVVCVHDGEGRDALPVHDRHGLYGTGFGADHLHCMGHHAQLLQCGLRGGAELLGVALQEPDDVCLADDVTHTPLVVKDSDAVHHVGLVVAAMHAPDFGLQQAVQDHLKQAGPRLRLVKEVAVKAYLL